MALHPLLDEVPVSSKHCIDSVHKQSNLVIEMHHAQVTKQLVKG